MQCRIPLTCDIVVHVNNVTGNDSTGTPYRSIPAAYKYISTQLDLAHFGVSIFLENTGVDYTPGLLAWSFLLGQRADFGLVIEGELTPDGTASAVTIADSGTGCIHMAGGGQIYVRNLKLKATGDARCLWAPYYGLIGVLNGVELLGSQAVMVNAGYPGTGGRVEFNSPWIIRANGPTGSGALAAGGFGQVIVQQTAPCTIVGVPDFSAFAFASVSEGGWISCFNTWSGSATGPRYFIQTGSTILSWNVLPGSTPGPVFGNGHYEGP